jgi:glycosyltransferase involved in cell wall biosynthesis
MRVAIFTDTFFPEVNGVAKTLGRWTNYLKENHIECKVFAPSTKHTHLDQDMMAERFLSIPFFLYPECRLTLANPLFMNKVIDQFAPTMIHVATPFNMGLHGQRYAIKNGIPLVASYHTNFDQYLAYYKIQWLENTYWKYMHWFHQECEKIFVPSESTKQYLQQQGFKQLEIWGRGIDTTKFFPVVDRTSFLLELGIDPYQFVLLYVGRLAPEKHVDILIQTFENLPERIRNHTHLIIAGDGPLYEDFVSANEEIVDSRITYLGFVEGAKLQKLYAAADVFVFPSPTETFGNVVLEAMACGTPVIGAAQGGVKDTIQDGINGILCPVGNIDAFSSAIEKLHDDEAFRLNIIQNGLRYSRDQSWDAIFAKLLVDYHSISEKNASELVI